MGLDIDKITSNLRAWVLML